MLRGGEPVVILTSAFDTLQAYTQATTMQTAEQQAIEETLYLEEQQVPASLQPHSNVDAATAAGLEAKEVSACEQCHRFFPTSTVAAFPVPADQAESHTAGDMVTLCGHCAVGRRIQVWWTEDKQWYSGVLDAYDVLTDLHRV